MDTYRTIEAPAQGLYKEKGSRFIAFACMLSSPEEVKDTVQKLRRQYHDARHVCFAYSIGARNLQTRANDDGEPSGTAGKPILNAILSQNLTNVLIVVVRYFGGVKLGTSGLATAYRAAAADALANSIIVERTIDVEYFVEFQYPQLNDVMSAIKDFGCELLQQQFEMTCSLRFRIREKDAPQLEGRLQKIEGLRIGMSCSDG